MRRNSLKPVEIAARIGVKAPYISMLIHRKRQPSEQFLRSFETLEREFEDPFLAACAEILTSGNDSAAEWFTQSIYSALARIDDRQAKRLRDIEPAYHKQRRGRTRLRDAG